MIIKIILVGLLIYMVVNLFLAMRIMLKDTPPDKPMSKYIGRRVLTSVCIVLIILIAMATGLIHPNPRPY
ncbi:DUF2909 domain-containing protein [Salinimonas sediminis]|uniref:DUF2909 domain-containing protein n=1 Tax=Salinimonas sediminis TaxID=2303538 RepID=A0A346NHG3_9ALTE|nr:DUF2909 domain-containing protein [Salinimonas sediminis]AXR04970.1 DUF2909 domain-containing protein [Salinimonas sediminis]